MKKNPNNFSLELIPKKIPQYSHNSIHEDNAQSSVDLEKCLIWIGKFQMKIYSVC